MAVDREAEKQQQLNIRPKEEDEDGYQCGGESLLSLVQPELAALSQHWLNALRDHALLSLPAGGCYVVELTPSEKYLYHTPSAQLA